MAPVLLTLVCHLGATEMRASLHMPNSVGVPTYPNCSLQGAVVPLGCEEQLRRDGILDCECNTTVQHLSRVKNAFVVVRNPFARFISIYRYILERWSTKYKNADFISIHNFSSLFQGHHPTQKFKADLFYGKGHTSWHWAQQMVHILPICRLVPHTKLIPAEPDVLENLSPVVQDINRMMTGTSGHELPDPMGVASRNKISDAGCPWQCYFELCGIPCFHIVLQWYDLDVIVLHTAGVYPAPRSIADLWAGSPWSAVANREGRCLQVCR